MSEEALGRRAAACSGWRWRAGMCTHLLETVVSVGTGMIVVVPPERPIDGVRRVTDAARLPRLDDHATLGCLLRLVREAWMTDEVWAHTQYDRSDTRSGREWVALIDRRGGDYIGADSVHRFVAPTEAEALVLALESAP